MPVAPELIRNGDGKEKQDCRRNAGKRWLRKHGKNHVSEIFYIEPDRVPVTYDTGAGEQGFQGGPVELS
jgi:hypothetical protein